MPRHNKPLVDVEPEIMKLTKTDEILKLKEELKIKRKEARKAYNKDYVKKLYHHIKENNPEKHLERVLKEKQRYKDKIDIYKANNRRRQEMLKEGERLLKEKEEKELLKENK